MVQMHGTLFERYPEAQSIAVAGFYGLSQEFGSFALSDYVRIEPANPALERVYLPRLPQGVTPPRHYLVACAPDDRYYEPHRQLRSIPDALSSITLAHQCLSIYHGFPYHVSYQFGFSRRPGTVAMLLSTPGGAVPRHHEFADELFHPATTRLGFFWSRFAEPEGVRSFFVELAKSYVEVIDQRWLVAANKYVSGISCFFFHEAVIDLAISLEAFLNRGDQIAFSLSLHTALLIGNSYRERLQIVEDVKRFYRVRSRIIHGSYDRPSNGDVDLLMRIVDYLRRCLRATCGKQMAKEVYSELDYLILVGAPRYRRERVTSVVSEEDIVEVIRVAEAIDRGSKHWFELSDPDPDGDRELLLTFDVGGRRMGPYEVSRYIWRIPHVREWSKYEYWLSQDDSGRFVLLIDGIERSTS